MFLLAFLFEFWFGSLCALGNPVATKTFGACRNVVRGWFCLSGAFHNRVEREGSRPQGMCITKNERSAHQRREAKRTKKDRSPL